MTTSVVVEIAPADESSPSARSLLDACNVGMHEGRCVFGHDANLDEEGRAVVILTWEGGAESRARVEVGLRIRGRPRWQTRFLPFSAADPEGERWRAVGFAIATTVGETVARESTATARDAKSPAATSPAAGEAQRPERGTVDRSWMDAQFSMSGWGASRALAGEVRFSRRIPGDRLFFFGAARCAIEEVPRDELTILLPSGAAGAGLALFRLPGGVEVAARAQGMVELIDATATDAATGVRGGAQRWVAGLGEVLDASWMWSSWVGIAAGVGLLETMGPTDVTAHGQVLAHIAPAQLEVAAGLQVAVP